MITLDTSAIVALVSPNDSRHGAATAVLERDRRRTIVPALVMSEVAWMIGGRMGQRYLLGFLEGIESGSSFLDCGDADLPRIRELITRYADLRLGFADAAVIACAERNGGSVLTFDRRDFDLIAGEGLITIIP